MQLRMTIEVSDDTDPTLVDPHDVAEHILAVYKPGCRTGLHDTPYDVEFVDAEWAEEFGGAQTP